MRIEDRTTAQNCKKKLCVFAIVLIFYSLQLILTFRGVYSKIQSESIPLKYAMVRLTTVFSRETSVNVICLNYMNIIYHFGLYYIVLIYTLFKKGSIFVTTITPFRFSEFSFAASKSFVTRIYFFLNILNKYNICCEMCNNYIFFCTCHCSVSSLKI